MRLPTRLQRLGVVLLTAGSLSFPAAAQQYGNLHGTVSDEEGAALPGVSMTLTGMGAPRVTTTGARGGYRFLNLDPGVYSLTAALDGFSTLEQPRVVVALNRNVILDFTLSGAVQELMTVTAAALADPPGRRGRRGGVRRLPGGRRA